MRNWYLVPLALCAAVVVATVLAMFFVPAGGEPGTRGLHYFWLAVFGYVPALVLALVASFGARGRTGPYALWARRLPMLLLLLLVLPLVFNTLVRIIYTSW